MSVLRLLPRRGGLWLLLIVFASSYFFFDRSSPLNGFARNGGAASSSDWLPGSVAGGDTPEDRAERQFQREAQEAGKEAHFIQDVLQDGTERPGRWSWVKGKLGWTADDDDEADEQDSDTLAGDAEDQQSNKKNAFELKYGTENAASTEEDAEMAYHAHLEKEHSPHSYTKHSPTLTFDHIYVVSLPKRTDRRERMDKIARALGLKFTYIDAMSKDSSMLGWIAERVSEVRQRKRPILAGALGIPEDEVGGMGVDSHWLKTADRRIGLHFPDLKTLDERWHLVKGKSVPENDERVAGEGRVVDWVTYLEKTEDHTSLQPSDPAVNVQELLHDPMEKLEARQINDAVLATWYSQVNAWKQVVENKDASALILEDDIDLEWDIERIWPNIERALPPTWEIVLLGHCWGHELSRKRHHKPVPAHA